MEWKPIPGFPGYEASAAGEIRAAKSRVRARQGQPLKPWTVERHGRLASYVQLGRGNKVLVHRLVCAAFHGPAPEGMNDCAHVNHNSLDNRASNLKWSTHADNMAENYSEEWWEAQARWQEAIGMEPGYNGPSHGVPF